MALSKDARAELLKSVGIAHGADGFDLEALVQLASQRGWTCTTTPSRTHDGRPGRWRASVFVQSPVGGARTWVLMGSRGAGATEAEALEKAIATTLARGQHLSGNAAN
jgi:hypothetical protein